MKYTIERASSFFTNNQPCKEAYRDKESDLWIVEIEDLDAFIEKYKRIVIDCNGFLDGIKHIIIYDDYIE